ncbi:type IV pilin-like G/H family protein [Arthrospira platensis]|uniref:type IV pilin-like G/H family protein n=1 Tax=Limnospira TaxID=2596745 RepID=UPI0001C3949D|nr:type IV pilin-like G/H family protein [Arthrospira platensis]AMW31526.1 pesticin [Arthrospira platensis YZ]KDR58883.1 pesticin [Arthrospira platensis str. Paraca]MBD2668931.1 type IV pilin-like G/H family protein [Arthrospira platensis FACHB-439]MBD2709367.1 type IV pilin-like G/H family protein [Arthrospira platensis FACHB-835]MDT9296968.1 type IV pilin-like G/H family protein [Arthrospira platensis PCC 7345]MDT9311981.1 type IV pilin-like G/H family protein [Limnospira sp. Paracas R14]Q
MKTELKAKFLQHISQKKRDGGFTLIELLVVIIIIGILSAIALPSFLNQANKARESEAKTYVGSINRAQQARLMETGEFTASIAQLGLGVSSATANYTYNLAADASGAVVNAKGIANLRDYGGLVWVGTTVGGERTTLAKLCEAPDATTEATFTPGANSCGTFREI